MNKSKSCHMDLVIDVCSFLLTLIFQKDGKVNHFIYSRVGIIDKFNYLRLWAELF